MFFVNDPGPWQSFILRGDNVGRPINEVTQKYLHEQLQFDNFMSMQQQLQVQQFQNKGPLTENEFTFTFEINVENDGDFFRPSIGTTDTGTTDIIIDWGDGSPRTSGSLEPLSSQSFRHNYSTAGSYTVGIIATSPSSIYTVAADQND